MKIATAIAIVMLALLADALWSIYDQYSHETQHYDVVMGCEQADHDPQDDLCSIEE